MIIKALISFYNQGNYKPSQMNSIYISIIIKYSGYGNCFLYSLTKDLRRRCFKHSVLARPPPPLSVSLSASVSLYIIIYIRASWRPDIHTLLTSYVEAMCEGLGPLGWRR